MRTLVISDIHGNIDALTAVFDEPCDNIVCMGDIVDYGPSPRDCVEFLREWDIIRARGNHDHAVAFCADCQTPDGPLRKLSVSSRQYTTQALDNLQKSWLGEADTGVYAGHGSQRIFAAHGAPSNHMYKYLSPRLTDEELLGEVESVDADIICVGHTHQPFIKRLDGKLLINVGSVGQPRDGIAKACYAIIENGDAEIRRVAYDVQAAVAKTRVLPMEEAEIWQLVYLLEKAKAPPPA